MASKGVCGKYNISFITIILLNLTLPNISKPNQEIFLGGIKNFNEILQQICENLKGWL